MNPQILAPTSRLLSARYNKQFFPPVRHMNSLAIPLRHRASSALLFSNTATHQVRPSQVFALTRSVSLRAVSTTHSTNATASTQHAGEHAQRNDILDAHHLNNHGFTALRKPVFPTSSASEHYKFPQQANGSNGRSIFADMALYTTAFLLATVVYENWKKSSDTSSPFLDPINEDDYSPPETSPKEDSIDIGAGALIRAIDNSPVTMTDEKSSIKTMTLLTPEAVTKMLRQNEKTVILADWEAEEEAGVRKVEGIGNRAVKRYDTNALASNNPIEDDHSEHVMIGSGENNQLLFGVFDGHSGWNCSQRLAKELGIYAARSIEKHLGQGKKLIDDTDRIDQVIKALQMAFLELDEEIVQNSVKRFLENPSRTLATKILLPALAGSCALLAYVEQDDLYVACAGDSRAVLGVKDEETGKWIAVPMSVDHTGKNENEKRRLAAEHPGEEDSVIIRGRVLGGLEPTRAFGDARYKWSSEVQDQIFDSYFPGRRPLPKNFLTPPYVTARPEVIHRKLQSSDYFLVMATDGLWDKLSSQEVVELVGNYLDGKRTPSNPECAEENGDLKETIDPVKVIKTYAADHGIPDNLTTTTSSAPTPLRPETPHKPPSGKKKQFIYKDSNISTHLIRNALGATDEKLCSIMSIPAPMCRAFRDDITVTTLVFQSQSSRTTKVKDGL